MAYTIVKYDMELWFDENKEAEVIKVVDCDLAISTNIMIDGKVYHVCAKYQQNNLIGVRGIQLQSTPEDVEYEEHLTCPYCGEKDVDAWERSQDNDKIDCSTCGSEIEYSREVEITYSTKPIKRNNPIKL
ncbi:hypothetical protein P4I81_30240 [Bacillus cereus]|uniref:hypothetical protein n=1 Tax=Bacillus thuringiensis TaxID=1428 RepID=UPI000451B1C1|nr:hypothetical protein [Bacillus thuringiensis]MEB8638252.1 hypothetical protein [Bacillus cereus]EXY06149.1 hypothetical protein BF15_24795 [Bacillus thuringiensis]MEB8746494.1 hypothetical protein [Bacillus cereus]MEB8756015.1 hypothetical protein [Bacillus cereus]MEB8798188.1 hypothetical protein [Bacillus cereus]